MLKKIFSAALLNFWLFIACACGIILAYYFPSFLTFTLLFFISIILILFFYKQQKFLFSDICVAALFFSLGGLMFLPYASFNADEFLGKDSAYVLKVSSLPQNQSLKNTFLAEINQVNSIPVTIRVKVLDYSKKMNYLGRYKIIGKLSKRQFGNFDFYSLWVKSNTNLEELPPGMWDKITKRATYHLLNIFKKNLSDESYRFLASVFLGRRELLDREEKGIFTDAGIAHLLAISGSNVGVTAVVLFFILKLFNVRFKVCLLISIFFLFIYTLITGASPPILRATIMYAVFSLSFFVKRKLSPFNSLGMSGLVCLLINSSWLFDVGFQLSFLSIFALILGFKIFPITSSKIEFINQLKYLFFSSLYVTVLLTPLIAYYFGRVYILSVFNNIILIPFFSLILIVNFILIVLSPFKFIAQSIGSVLSALIPVFYNLSKVLGSIKFSFFFCHFSLLAIFGYYFVLALALISIARRKVKVEMKTKG